MNEKDKRKVTQEVDDSAESTQEVQLPVENIQTDVLNRETDSKLELDVSGQAEETSMPLVGDGIQKPDMPAESTQEVQLPVESVQTDVLNRETDSIPKLDVSGQAEEIPASLVDVDLGPSQPQVKEESQRVAEHLISSGAASQRPFGVVEETEEEAAAEQWEWRISRSEFTPLLLEIQGNKYKMTPQQGLALAEGTADMEEYFIYLVDYNQSPGMGQLILSTEFKYAEPMARKALEAAGELNSGGVLRIYDKSRIPGGQVRLTYEILPREEFSHLGDAYLSSKNGFIAMSTVSFLVSEIQRRRKGVHVFALHLPESILVVAGKRGTVFLSRRYTLFGEDEQSVYEGISMVVQDLRELEKTIGANFQQVEWITALSGALNLKRLDFEFIFSPQPLHEFTLGQFQFWSALPSALKEVSSKAVLVPKEEKLLRFLERKEKWALAVLLAFFVVFVVVAFQSFMRTSSLHAEGEQLSSLLDQSRAEANVRAGEINFSDIEPTYELSEAINQAAFYPPFGEVWNQLALARPEAVRVDGLEFSYGENKDVVVRIEGQVEQDLATAKSTLMEFVKNIEARGYEILGQHIKLDIEGSYFNLDARLPVEQKE